MRSCIFAHLRRITFKPVHINSWKNRGIASRKKRTRLSAHGVWVLGLLWPTCFVLLPTSPNNKRMATSFFVSNSSFFVFVKALSIVSTLSSSFLCSSWRISKLCRTLQLIITKILVNGPSSYNSLLMAKTVHTIPCQIAFAPARKPYPDRASVHTSERWFRCAISITERSWTYPGCQRLFMRGFRFRSSLKKWLAVSPLVSSAFGRTHVGLRPTKRSSPSHARKNLWYPG